MVQAFSFGQTSCQPGAAAVVDGQLIPEHRLARPLHCPPHDRLRLASRLGKDLDTPALTTEVRAIRHHPALGGESGRRRVPPAGTCSLDVPWELPSSARSARQAPPPMASGLASPLAGHVRVGDVMPANLTGIRVVVVEDHGDSREILEQMLRFYGAVVMTASTASDALAKAPDADIIVTDFALPPGEDGVWLLEQVN